MSRIDLSQPQWDQNTYIGRAKHFFTTTNPLNILATDQQLEEAKNLLEQYQNGKEPVKATEEELWKAKHLVESAYHPDTGEKNFVLGRMSFQVPGNMIITGCMVSFYKNPLAVISWQFINQSFNAVVNYTNRNASTDLSNMQLFGAYGIATTTSVATALSLNRFVERNPALRKTIIGRFVPFVAVAAANCLNIPLMRQRELFDGIDVSTEDGTYIGKSCSAAKSAVMQVIPSRILMAVPVMVLPPIAMNFLEKRTKLFQRCPPLSPIMTVAMTGLCLSVSTPLCCALFPQKSAMKIKHLESPLVEELKRKSSVLPTAVFYNKGL